MPAQKLIYQDANGYSVPLYFESKLMADFFYEAARSHGLTPTDWCQYDTVQTSDFRRVIDDLKTPEPEFD